MRENLTQIDKCLTNTVEDSGVMIEFLDGALKKLLRSALVAAQYLIYNRKDFLADKQKSPYTLLRALLRYNEASNFQGETNSPICNLFHTSVEHNNYPLIKIRILSYLRSLPSMQGGRKSEEVRLVLEHIQLLGYSIDSFKRAVYGLSDYHHQLVFSDYSDNLEDQNYFLSNLYLTQAGESYLETVMYNVSYIGEMIVGIPVEEDQYKGLATVLYTTERMHSIVRLLRYLGMQEEHEYTLWHRMAHKEAGEDNDKLVAILGKYLKVYGAELITQKLYFTCWPQWQKIFGTILKDRPVGGELRVQIGTIISDLQADVITSYNRQLDFLCCFQDALTVTLGADVQIILIRHDNS